MNPPSEVTLAHTVASGTDVLCLSVGSNNAGVSGTPVWDAVGVNETFTLIATAATTTGNHYFYRLVNPTVKTADITIAPSAETTIVGVAFNLQNVDTTTPITDSGTATGNSDTISNTRTTASGELVIDACNWQGNPGPLTIGADQTEIDKTGNTFAHLCSEQAGADGGLMTWTHQFAGGPWASIAASFQDAAAGANPHGPLGHPLYGPLAGPIAA